MIDGINLLDYLKLANILHALLSKHDLTRKLERRLEAWEVVRLDDTYYQDVQCK